MEKKEYADFLQSMEWKAVRNEYMKTHSKCIMCGRPASEVHHFKYETGELGYLNTKNLVSLCRSCHREVHLFDKLIMSFKGSDLAATWIIELFRKMIDVQAIDKFRFDEEYKRAEFAVGEYMYKLFFYSPNAREFIFVLISLSPEDVKHDILTFIDVAFPDTGSGMLERIKALDKRFEDRNKQFEEDIKVIHEVMNERSDNNGKT